MTIFLFCRGWVYLRPEARADMESAPTGVNVGAAICRPRADVGIGPYGIFLEVILWKRIF